MKLFCHHRSPICDGTVAQWLVPLPSRPMVVGSILDCCTKAFTFPHGGINKVFFLNEEADEMMML